MPYFSVTETTDGFVLFLFYFVLGFHCNDCQGVFCNFCTVSAIVFCVSTVMFSVAIVFSHRHITVVFGDSGVR